MPHELGHVAQQKKGQVQPTSTEAGIPVNDDVRLEREADVLGAKAARSGAVSSTPSSEGASTGNTVSQMLWDMKSFQEATLRRDVCKARNWSAGNRWSYKHL